MARIITALEDAFLPAAFRRKRLGPQVIGNDLPEQGGFSGNMQQQNLLMPTAEDNAPTLNAINTLRGMPQAAPVDPSLQQPQTVASAPAPTTNQPNVLAPKPASTDAYTSAMMADNPADAAPAKPNILNSNPTDKRGRPILNPNLQGDEQTLDYYKRIAAMPEDTKGGGWWPKIRAAIAGFAAGGPVGAAAAFGTRALREHFDPTLGSREYQKQKLGELAPAVQSIYAGRKEARAQEAEKASTDLAKARTDQILHPQKTAKFILKQDENGMFHPVNEATGLDPDGKPVKGKLSAAGSDWELKIDQKGRYTPVNKNTGLDPNGNPVSARPTAKNENDPTQVNAAIDRAIKDAQAEQAKIDEGLKGIPRTIETTDIFGQKKTVTNPDYNYNMTRRRKLDDDIRNWRIKKKSAASSTATSNENDPLGLDEPNNEQ